MAAQETNTIRIETTVGPCTLRKRGPKWYARIQRNKYRREIYLNATELPDAIARAQEVVPAAILGFQVLRSRGESLPNEAYYNRMYRDMVSRAKRREARCTVTPEEWAKVVSRAMGRCELTGISFSLVKSLRAFRAPFAPSVDRIQPKGDYTYGNIRLVCVAVNYALQDWGIGVFEAISYSYASRAISRLAGAMAGLEESQGTELNRDLQ